MKGYVFLMFSTFILNLPNQFDQAVVGATLVRVGPDAVMAPAGEAAAV